MAKYLLYNYTPSLAAAVFFVIIFLVTTLVHIFLTAKHRTKFLTALIIGGFMEALGYAARAVNAHQAPDYTTGPYALQSLFILLAPSLFAASIYMILGRIIRVTEGESRSLIPPSRLTKIFVTGDVVSFLIQSGGGGIMSSSKSENTLKLGEKVIVVGLIVQVLFFGFFCVVAVVFQKRINSKPTASSMKTPRRWHNCLMVLYSASLLIMVRCVYRVVEYIQGQTGVLQSHEYFAYVFDSLLMVLVMILLLFYHHNKVLLSYEEADEELLYGRING